MVNNLVKVIPNLNFFNLKKVNGKHPAIFFGHGFLPSAHARVKFELTSQWTGGL